MEWNVLSIQYLSIDNNDAVSNADIAAIWMVIDYFFFVFIFGFLGFLGRVWIGVLMIVGQ